MARLSGHPIAAASGHKVVPAGGAPRSTRAESAKRVLIVDDDFDARLSLEELFSAYGYETTIARDGEEALVLLSSGIPIHFVVLDLMMPRVSGYEFLKRKRRLAKPLRAIPVAVASAVAPPFIGEVVAVFQKPTPILELLSVVERHLGAAGTGNPAAS